MTRTAIYINEIVSFAVLLLMIVALVANEADATVQQAVRDRAASAETRPQEDTGAPPRVSMSLQVREAPLTVSVVLDAGPDGARMHD